MSQKTDKMLKLALVFFISLLSFSIGTFVGKKYSDNQHKLAALEPHGKTDETSSDFASNSDEKHDGEQAKAATKEGDVLLTDHEVAKIAEEFATDSSEPDTANEKTIKTAESEEKDIKEISPVNAPKHAVAPVKHEEHAAPTKHAETIAAAKPTLPVKEKHDEVKAEVKATVPRAVASLPPTANLQHYTVQVGSFATSAEAQKLSQDLISKGYKASFIPAQVNGQTWHRVQVGLFGTVTEAQNYKKDFLEKTHLSSAIVQRVQN
ncbi:MAG: SPOR domain-containing protein [Pseudobdellovibrio sp.]